MGSLTNKLNSRALQISARLRYSLFLHMIRTFYLSSFDKCVKYINDVMLMQVTPVETPGNFLTIYIKIQKFASWVRL